MHAPVVARERPSRLVILGHPVAHSRSPAFQNAALEACGIPLRYERLDVAPQRLDAMLQSLAAEGVGGNVTIPHKEVVASRATCSALAARVGAVNTFWHEAGMLYGHNTDVAGAVATIASLFPHGFQGASCALLGAGGSAAAVLVALEIAGCHDIRIAARTTRRAELLATRVGVKVRVETSTADAVRNASLIINATPVGLHDDAMPVLPSEMVSDAVIFDLVYRAGETAWVRACRAAGHRAIDGERMLMEQGAAAFECWFGIEAPREVMWKAITRPES